MRKRPYANIHVRLDPKYKKMLKKIAEHNNRTLTASLELAIHAEYVKLQRDKEDGN